MDKLTKYVVENKKLFCKPSKNSLGNFYYQP